MRLGQFHHVSSGVPLHIGRVDHGQSSRRQPLARNEFENVERIANEAVQIHGGYGFIKDYPAEKFYRDVKLCTIGEGTSEIQRLVIARQLLRD